MEKEEENIKKQRRERQVGRACKQWQTSSLVIARELPAFGLFPIAFQRHNPQMSSGVKRMRRATGGPELRGQSSRPTESPMNWGLEHCLSLSSSDPWSQIQGVDLDNVLPLTFCSLRMLATCCLAYLGRFILSSVFSVLPSSFPRGPCCLKVLLAQRCRVVAASTAGSIESGPKLWAGTPLLAKLN
jgi:hypothetical protein